MSGDVETLKADLGRWAILLGVAQVTVGCIVGFTPPTAVSWFRGIVMAHIEFAMNGILMIVLGLLTARLRLGRAALWTWFATLQAGTWMNGAAGLAAAFLGATSPLMTTLNEKFPPPHGTSHPLVTGSLQICGITIMIALLLTLYGLRPSRQPARASA